MRVKRPDLSERNRQNAKHGMCETSTYTIWRRMKVRCTKEDAKDFPRYGGRGISICERWLSFENFLEDMGVRPEGMQIDRINNDGNYEPSNCKWVTPRENSNNRRSSVFIEYMGKKQTIAQWAREIGVGPKTLRNRILSGWTVDNALTLKADYRNRRKLNVK